MESQLYLLGGLGALLMGTTLGVFGAGGSILTVPLLVYLFHYPPTQATHFSLLVVGTVSAFGVARDRSSGSLPLGSLAGFALPAMGGMFLVRRVLLPAIPARMTLAGAVVTLDSLILIVFALFMILASLSMLFVRVGDSGPQRRSTALETTSLGLVGFLVGMATGFVGAGGGFLIVPALVFLARFPMRDATRGSLLVIALNSLWGFGSSLSASHAIPWGSLGLVIAAAIGGMAAGLQIKGRLPAERLKPAFGVFVLLMGSYVLWRAL